MLVSAINGNFSILFGSNTIEMKYYRFSEKIQDFSLIEIADQRELFILSNVVYTEFAFPTPD